jgi:hypothetical protein
MNTTTATTSATKGAKRVTKKPGAAAAAPAIEVEEQIQPTATATTTATAPASDAIPEASETTAAVQKKVVTVDEEIAAAIKQLTAIRDGAMEALAVFKRLAKAHTREVKDARKRKRVKKEESEGGATAATDDRPCIFTTPVTIADSLCALFGKPNGSKMMPTEVTRAINTYVDENGLKADEKNMVRPNQDMIKALAIPTTDLVDGAIPRRMLQKYLYKLYMKDVAPAAGGAGTA